MYLKLKEMLLKSKIDQDVFRLANIKQYRPELLCFMVIIIEKNTIKRFINSKGEAKRKTVKIDKTKCSYKIRRVYKSSSSFRISSFKKANYSVFIEIIL